MGAGASSTDDSITEREKKFFDEMQRAYDQEYKPKVAERKMERKESLDFFKAKITSFVASEPKSPGKPKKSESKTEPKGDEHRKPARPVVQRTISSVQPPPAFFVGDIVKAKVDGMMFEGVVIANGGEEHDQDSVDVDFGDEVERVKIDNCALVMSGLDFEVGDVIQARTVENYLYCNGTILKINLDGTMDILFDGDDESDVERNIPHHLVRKLRTGRELAKKRWMRARTVISTMRAFNH